MQDWLLKGAIETDEKMAMDLADPTTGTAGVDLRAGSGVNGSRGERLESSMSFKSFAVEEFQDQSVARHRGQAHPGSVREQDSAASDQDHGAAA
jgi:hypothetical protein